jgi:hypothetical protein
MDASRRYYIDSGCWQEWRTADIYNSHGSGWNRGHNLTFSVTATSSVAPNLTSTAATVKVVVNSSTDIVTITNATYRIKTRRR